MSLWLCDVHGCCQTQSSVRIYNIIAALARGSGVDVREAWFWHVLCHLL